MKKTGRRILSVLMSVLMMFCTMPLTVFAANNVEYLERSWDGKKVVEETKTANAVNISSVSTDLSSSWYYVSGNVTFSKRLNVTGSTVHLILCDGATLHAELGIHVGPGKTFIVHGQANDSGKIQIDDCDKYEAGIGSNDYDDDGETTAGTMIFQGGQIGSRGGNDGAGIGGGNESAGGVVEIYGGSVYASSATDGAGIGGGDNGSGGNVTIYGGHVRAYGGGYGAGIGGGDKDTSTARGGVTYIYGGTVEAYGGTDAAGIGGGEGSDARYTEIYGGTVTATGGKYGAGIGGGQDGDGGYIYIRGGTVTAKGGVDAAGIGGGETGHGGNIYISGGSVTATGNEYGAGIGGGEDCDGGTIYISGGEVTATGGTSNSFGNVGGGAGIGGGCDGTGGTITITGGKITATGGLQAAGIGGGYIGRSGTIVINGGEIKAVGECGAGIGNGALNCIDVNITINGGTIDAWGGDKLDSGGYPAAAIGVGATKGSNQTDVCEFSGTIRLNGGNITTHSYLCSREIIMSEELDYERVKAVVGSAVGGNSFYLEQLEGDIYIGGGVTLNTNAVNTISGGVRVIGDRESYVSAEDELSTPIGSKNIHFIDGDKIGSMVRYDDTIVAKNKRVSEARSYHKNLIIEPCEHSFIDGYVNITSDTHDRVCEYCEATFVEEHTFNTVWTEDESGKKNRVSTCELCGYEAETTVDEYVAAVEPYIDEDGAYILGDVEHYVIDGKNYAVNADGSVGDELEEINTLSYFEFSGEYQLTITHYTGPTDITELVIPKTYNGKNITALGSGNTNDQFLSNGTDAPFDLVLTENIRTINAYAFWASKVKEVKGDTSLLSKINAYAFSWANPDNDFKVVFNLDRDVSYAATAFSNLNAVVNMKHEYKLTNNSVTNPNYQSLTYNFTDEHEFAENKWEWSDHYNKATLTFSACSKNELCEATETIDATVTYEDKDGKRIYTATAEYNGETYTDTVEAGEYFVAVEPYVDEDGTYVFGVKEHYEMGGKNYVVNEDGSIGEELDSIVLSYFNMEEGYDGAYTDEKLKGTLTMTGYTGPTDNLTELVIPKVYDGKKVTAISGFSDKILQQPFTVVLNENITMLGFAFKNQPVTAVTGNTTSLRIITSDTFTIEDTEEKIPLTINWFKETDDSTWIFSDAFTNRLVTFRLKHSFKGFGDLATLPSDAIYDFIDEHTFTENEWTWSDDFTTAKVTLSNCTGNALCTETETIDAAVTREVKNGTCVMTATAEYNGTEYTDIKEGEIPATAANDKYNLTIVEDIDTNILVDVAGHEANGEVIDYIEYEYPDVNTQSGDTLKKTVQASEITADGSGYYAMTVTMAMAQINEPITATIHFTNGMAKEFTVSVVKYCKYIIDNAAANGYSEKLVDLCYSVLDYGKTASDYFSYGTPYSDYTLPEKFSAVPEITSQAGLKKGDVVTGIASTQMFILSKATMRITFKDDISALEVVSAKVGERTLDAAIVEAPNNKWAVDISGIYATELNKPILIELSDGTKVQYAATDWAKSILAYSTNNKSKALAKALYYYSKTANDYFGG